MTDESTFESWAILELMGHRRMAGLVSEQTIGGQAFLRIDVPETKEQAAFTQFYGAGSVYCMTPTTEEIARAVAAMSQVKPVQKYELALPEPRRPYDADNDPLRPMQDNDEEDDPAPGCQNCGLRDICPFEDEPDSRACNRWVPQADG